MSAEGYQGAEAMGGGGGSSVSVTLAQAYANGAAGADSTFTLDVTRGGLVVDGSAATSAPPLLVKNGKTISGVELQVVGSAGTGLLLRDSSGVHQGGLGFAVTAADFEASSSAGDVVLYSLVNKIRISTQVAGGITANTGNASLVLTNSGGSQLKYSTANVTVASSTVSVTVGGTLVLNATSAGVFGASGASGNFTLGSTSNATKGFVYLGSSTGLAYDETNKRVGINNPSPDAVWTSGATLGVQTVFGAGSATSFISVQNATAATFSGFICGDSQAHSLRLYWSTDNTSAQISTGAGPLDIGPTGNLTFYTNKWVLTSAGVMTLGSGVNLALNTTTGTKIGTATNQKLGFYNATAIVQPNTTGTATGFTAGVGTAVKDDSTFTGGSGSTAYRISDVVLALKSLGLMAV